MKASRGMVGQPGKERRTTAATSPSPRERDSSARRVQEPDEIGRHHQALVDDSARTVKLGVLQLVVSRSARLAAQAGANGVVQRYCDHPFCDDPDCHDRRNHRDPVPLGGDFQRDRARAMMDAEQRARFSHVTREQHAEAILQQGLRASRGGQGGAGAALGGDQGAAFQQNSRGFVHLGQDAGLPSGDRPTRFYSQFYADQGIPSQALTVYPGEEQLAAMRDDPDDPAGGRFRLPVDVPPQQISRIPLAVRPLGQEGPEHVPRAMPGATRQQLPPRWQGAQDDEILDGIRSSIPSLEQIEAATTVAELARIAERLRQLARIGHWQGGTDVEYRRMSARLTERLREL